MLRSRRVHALRSLDPTTSVRLFTERAAAVDSSFVIADADAGAVEHLCRRLDANPLALAQCGRRACVPELRQPFRTRAGCVFLIEFS